MFHCSLGNRPCGARLKRAGKHVQEGLNQRFSALRQLSLEVHLMDNAPPGVATALIPLAHLTVCAHGNLGIHRCTP